MTVLGEHMGPQIPCRNSADPWQNQCNKPYNGLCERFIRPTPSINQNAKSGMIKELAKTNPKALDHTACLGMR